MGILDLFRKEEKSEVVMKILNTSNNALNTFQTSCNPTDKKGLFEVLMFNVFFCWSYYHERDLFYPNKGMVLVKLNFLHKKSTDFGIDLKYSEFTKLYQKRFSDFKEELKIFVKSDYPRTKQYLPKYIFSVFYYEQLKLFPDVSDILDSWISLQSDEYEDSNLEERRGVTKYNELAEFTADFQMYLNSIIDTLESNN